MPAEHRAAFVVSFRLQGEGFFQDWLGAAFVISTANTEQLA